MPPIRSCAAPADHGAHWDEIEVRLRGERWQFGGNGMAAVTRKTLLSLLQQRAAEAGVDIRFATPAEPGDLLQAAYHLAIAADEANSDANRSRMSSVPRWRPRRPSSSGRHNLPVRRPDLRTRAGPARRLRGARLPDRRRDLDVPRRGRRAILARRLLDAFDPGQPPGPSDESSRTYLENLFAEQIGGCPLLVNNSRWANFRTWRTARWRHRAGPTAIALLGDAAHTAHFSVGSGTKMAMEDAVALVAALDQHASGSQPARDAVDAALATYEAARRPQVTRIQDAARPSLSWWEHFGRSYQVLPPWQFAYHFFSRSLPESKLRQRDPSFVEAVHEGWRAAHGGATDPLHTPIDIAGRPQPDRMIPVTRKAAQLAACPLPLLPGPPPPGASGPPGQHRPWGQWISAPDTEADLHQASEEVARGLADGACLVAVGDGTPLTRRLVCEAARLGRGAVTMLIEPADGADAEDVARTVVLSGRADLVGRLVTGAVLP